MANKTVQLKFDAAGRTWRYLNWLSEIESHPKITSEHVLNMAIRRYEEQWLPFVAEYNNCPLIVPLDIAWVWHCHILAPEAYRRDCMNLFGKIINHYSLLKDFKDNDNKADKETRAKWQKMFPDIPFEVDIDGEENRPVSSFRSKLSYNIRRAASHQKTFYYQVSLPHYKQSVYMNNAFERYKKFLYLRKTYPEKVLIPCIDIELVWRAHILLPGRYSSDCEKLFGSLFDHRDTTYDRRPGTTLYTLQQQTAKVWKQTFGENYYYPGSMHRGIPDFSEYGQIEESDKIRMCATNLRVNVCKISVEGLSSEMHGMQLTFTGSKTKENLEKIDLPDCVFEGSQTFIIHKPDEKLLISLTGMNKSGRQKEIGKKKVLVSSLKEKVKKLTDTVSVTETIGLGNGVSVFLELDLSFHWDDTARFGFVPGKFKKSDPEMTERMLGPIPNLITDNKTVCMTATHRVLDESANVLFSCYMFRSENPTMNGFHLYYKNSLVVTGHQVSANQLPFTRVGKAWLSDCAAINQADRQKAMLLKNYTGDLNIHFYRRCIPKKKSEYSDGVYFSGFYNLKDTGNEGFKAKTGFHTRNEDGVTNVTGTDHRNHMLWVSTQDGHLAESVANELSHASLHLICESKASSLFNNRHKVKTEKIPKNLRQPKKQSKPKDTQKYNEKQLKEMQKNMKIAKKFADKFQDELEEGEETADAEFSVENEFGGVENDENDFEAEFPEMYETFKEDIGGYGDDMGVLDDVASSGYCVDISESYTPASTGGFTSYHDDTSFTGGASGFDGGMGQFNVDMPTTNMESFFPAYENGECYIGEDF